MANQYGGAWHPPPLTGLVDGRFNRVLLTLADRTAEIRELFLPVEAVARVRERRIDIGQGRSYTVLEWDHDDDAHVPGMASLLRYLATLVAGQPGEIGPRGPPGPEVYS